MADIKKIKIGSNTYDLRDGRVITLVDKGSTTAGTWLASTDSPTQNLTSYTDGQLFLYKVTVAGATTTTLNIDSLGAKTIYRGSSSKLTTHYGVGSYLLLYYSANLNSGCFMVVNDYATDNDKKTASGNTSSKIYLIGATSQSSSGQTTYSHDTVYIGTDGHLYCNGAKVDHIGHIHASETESAAPQGHTHTVTVNGVTGAYSGTAVTALTGVKASSSSSAAPGGHTHSYDKTTGINLTANSTTDTGRIKYAESISGSKPTLEGTTTFVTEISSGSGSLKSYTAATNGNTVTSSGRIKYVDSITNGSASGTGANAAAPANHDHTFSYTSYALNGLNSSHTTKYMKLNTTAADTDTVGISGGSGSLKSYSAATNGTAVTESGRIKYIDSIVYNEPELTGPTTFITKQGTFTAGTTPVDSASPGVTSTNSSSNSGTTGTIASYSAGVLTINSTVNSGSHTHAYDKTTSITLTRGTAPSLSDATTGSISLNAGSITPTTYYLAHTHTAASLTGTTTFATNGIKTASLSASSTSTDGPAYVETAKNSTLSLKAGTVDSKTGTNSGTAVPTISGVSYTPPSATTYYLEHVHTEATVSKTGEVSISGGEYTAITQHLSASPAYTSTKTTGNSGTNFNAVTGVAATGTANVTPSDHTHSYGSSTALTTDSNNGTPVDAIVEIKPSSNN